MGPIRRRAPPDGAPTTFDSEYDMLKWAVILALVALAAGVVGFAGLAAGVVGIAGLAAGVVGSSGLTVGAAGVAKMLFLLFMLAFVAVVMTIVLGMNDAEP